MEQLSRFAYLASPRAFQLILVLVRLHLLGEDPLLDLLDRHYVIGLSCPLLEVSLYDGLSGTVHHSHAVVQRSRDLRLTDTLADCQGVLGGVVRRRYHRPAVAPVRGPC